MLVLLDVQLYLCCILCFSAANPDTNYPGGTEKVYEYHKTLVCLKYCVLVLEVINCF